VFKVQDHTDPQFCDPQIIQHQPPFVIRDFVDHLRIHHDKIERDQIGHEGADLVPFIEHIKDRLLLKGNVAQPKLYHECIFIRLLNPAYIRQLPDYSETFREQAARQANDELNSNDEAAN
jgi:hypothetical protein